MKNREISIPNITISAPQGHSGKTLVSIALCACLRERGLAIQPFKKGPDYIDPSWLMAAAGRACRNLDTVMIPEEALTVSFRRACQGADIALIEGAMGLYDGFESGGRGSTADVAGLLGSPIIMVVNTARMTRSVAAMISGYQHFQPGVNIAGVILNNVAGPRHEQKMAASIEAHCGIPVLGSVPRDDSLVISERHLGLVPYREAGPNSIVHRIQRRLQDKLDIDRILDIAHKAQTPGAVSLSTASKKAFIARIGVIYDKAFTFYYQENLEALAQAGAELLFIDSLQDSELPLLDALYIGGGFPEVFLLELEGNRSLRQSIAKAIEDYLPVYAECAGLMYLCRGITWRDRRAEMVGAIPAEIEIRPRPQGHGYVYVEVTGENPFLPLGLKFWGHEFHHSALIGGGECHTAYRVGRGKGIGNGADGIVYKNVLAAYTHLHALGVPQWAKGFTALAAKYRNSRRTLDIKRRKTAII